MGVNSCQEVKKFIEVLISRDFTFSFSSSSSVSTWQLVDYKTVKLSFHTHILYMQCLPSTCGSCNRHRICKSLVKHVTHYFG